MSDSRTKNSIRNVSFFAGSKIVQLLMTFITRTLLIKYLGVEILSLDGLFSSILTVLSLADLGLGSAIIYSLYEPLVKNDKEKIAAYISLFQKIYSIIGIIITIIGICLIPALPYLVNMPESVDNINLIYVLTILGTSVTYFFSSRRIIFEADQKLYKVTAVDAASNIIMQLVQIVLIACYKNYIIVLVNRILFAFVNNFIIYYFGNRKYQYLRFGKKSKLQIAEIQALFKNTGVILCHKVGGVFVTGTDNIIISAFINTILAGYYSNYLLIINSITTFITMGLNALIPSIGNLKVESSDINHHYSVYEMVLLINYVASSFCTIALVCLINPFIELWLGKEFTFEMGIVVLLCVNFYVSTMRYGIGAFSTAAGYFKETVAKPFAEATINIAVSLLLVRKIGLYGVFLGTFASLIFGSVWIDPYVLYKKWFKKDIGIHLKVYMTMLICTGIIGGVTMIACSQVKMDSLLLNLLIRAILVCIISLPLLMASMIKLPGHQLLLFKFKKTKDKIINRKIIK